MSIFPLILPALAALPLLTKVALGAAAAKGVAGGLQALTSGARKREKEVEALAGQSPTYSGSRELERNYNESLRRYQQSPYQNAKFIMGKNLAERGQANALTALTNRNQGLAGAGRLASVSANQVNQLVGQAEEDRRRDFATLQQAGRSLASDKLTQFDINQMTPYNRKFGLAQMKAQAANERKNAGIRAIGSALGDIASIGMLGMDGAKSTTAATKSFSEAQEPGTQAARTTNLGTYTAETNPNYISPTMPRANKYLYGINPFNMKGMQTLIPKRTNLKLKGI